MLRPDDILIFFVLWFVGGAIRSLLDRSIADKLINGTLWGLALAIPSFFILVY